ncbi:MAG: alpha/beta fold hydrolase [Bdellovibrio sp.]|nr:alpha/beta fold hydrolase [Bdellovibrio sp.]
MEKYSVGSLNLTVVDSEKNLQFPALTLYPTQEKSSPVSFGKYQIEIAPNANPAAGTFPVVVISHGGGGNPLLYRDLAVHLAKHGFIVSLPEHPGNNRSDNSLENTNENLELRPRHVKLCADAVMADAKLKDCVLKEKTAVIGHSLGGYTALAAAGGMPWLSMKEKLLVESDPRVHAVVLMAPATAWFVHGGSLRNVTASILLYHAELDTLTTTWQAQLVQDYIPHKNNLKMVCVENAGHYSFLAPFPADMKSPNFPPSMDPPGFDREAFHVTMNEEIKDFLLEKFK